MEGLFLPKFQARCLGIECSWQLQLRLSAKPPAYSVGENHAIQDFCRGGPYVS
jgi:hypothetical protein